MKYTSAAEMARDIVGDGKRPNKFFVTISYGWYLPKYDPSTEDAPDMLQVKGAFKSTTVGPFRTYEEAVNLVIEWPIDTDHINRYGIEGTDATQVYVEDRLHGVLYERRLEERHDGSFHVSTIH